MVKVYWGAEALAQQPVSWSAQVFRERIGPDAIRATQCFAGDPTDENSQPLDTMQKLTDWYRPHKNPSKPPWTNK